MKSTTEITQEDFTAIENGELRVVTTKSRYGYAIGDELKVEVVDRKDQCSPIKILRKDDNDTYWIKKSDFDLVVAADSETFEIYNMMNASELVEELARLKDKKEPCQSRIEELTVSVSALEKDIKVIQNDISIKFGLGNITCGGLSTFEYTEVVEGENITNEIVKLIREGSAAIKMKSDKWSNKAGSILGIDSMGNFDIEDKNDVIQIKDLSDGAFEWINVRNFEILINNPEVESKVEAGVSLDSIYNSYVIKAKELKALQDSVISERKILEDLKGGIALIKRLGCAMFKGE